MPQTIALALPLVPGKLEAWRAFRTELTGARAEAYQGFMKRLGLSREQAFHQPTPEGDIAVLVIAGEDPGAMFGKLVGSTDPFDRWYVEQVTELHGMNRAIMQQVRPGTLVGDASA